MLFCFPHSKFEELHSVNSSLSSKLENVQAEYGSYQSEQEAQLTLLREQLASETKRASSLEEEITQTSAAASKCPYKIIVSLPQDLE